jgi:hypothetical protein
MPRRQQGNRSPPSSFEFLGQRKNRHMLYIGACVFSLCCTRHAM